MKNLFLLLTVAAVLAPAQTRLYMVGRFDTYADQKAPPNAGWTRTAGGTRGYLRTPKGTTAFSDGLFNSWTAGLISVDRQYVSRPMAAGVVFTSGVTSVKAQLLAREAAADDNSTSRMHVRIVSRDGRTNRATLLAVGQYGPATELLETGFRNKTYADGDTVSASYTTVAGDRIVVEVGFSDAAGTSPNGAFRLGDNATDLAENETDTADGAAWVEFSNTVTFESNVIEIRIGGTASSKTSSTTIVALVETLNSGESLIVGLAHDPETVNTVTWNSIGLTKAVEITNVGNVQCSIWYLLNPTAGSGDIVATFNAAVVAKTMLWLRPRPLLPAGLDAISTGTGSSTAPLDTAVATTVAREIFIGIVGIEGPSDDAFGTWGQAWDNPENQPFGTNDQTAQQRIGTTGGGAASNITGNMGRKIVSATESSQAALTGITSRDWCVVHATFKEDPAPPPPVSCSSKLEPMGVTRCW